jgi:Transglycosylase SLT domain
MGVSRRTRRLSTSAALALVLALAGAASPVTGPDGPGSAAALADATFGPGSAAQPNASVTVVQPAEAQTPPPAIRIAATGVTAGAAVQLDIADVLLDAYRAAVTRSPAGCHLPVSLLAAIGQVESGSLVGLPIDRAHRTSVVGPVLDGNGFAAIPDTDGGYWDGDAKWDRAVGPMQFLPGAWRTFGADADGDGVANPQDVEDAAAGTAAYLCYGGRDLSDPAALRTAIVSYNHSVAYLRLVLTYQQRFAGLGLDDGATVAGLPTHLALSAVETTPDGWAAGRVSAHATGKAAKHPAKPTKSAGPTPSASASPSGTPTPSPTGTSTTVAAAPPAGTTSAAPSPVTEPSPSSGPTTSDDPTGSDPSPSDDPSPSSPSPDPSPASTCPTAPPDPDATPSPTDTPSPTPTDGTCPPCPPGTDPTEQAPCAPATQPSTEPAPDPSPSSAPASPAGTATTDASSSSVP